MTTNDEVPAVEQQSKTESIGIQASTEADPKSKDLEEQQRLARDWQPDVDGPYISKVQPLEDIIKNFEPSDSRSLKIKNLAKQFPYYRRMKGDGSCGWRALFFGFLLNLCQSHLDGGEHPEEFFSPVIDKHVKAMKDRGFDEMIFEDWVETARQTAKRLSEELRQQNGVEKSELKRQIAKGLEDDFNDEEKNMELIQYVRMATSSWLIIVNPDSVAPFIDNGLSIEQWCNRYVDPVAAELEDLSMKGVFDAFMEQAGMNLLIHDLEKGEGDQVQVYEHEAGQASGNAKSKKTPSLHVLYRPGHYDLLLQESWS